MCGLTFTVLVINLLIRTARSSDVFSSVAELEYLYNKEKIVGRLLEDLLRQSKDVIQNDSVHQYLTELKEIQTAGLDSRGVIGNPINAFHLMRRLAVEWNQVKSSLVNQSNDNVKTILGISQTFPTIEDFSGAAVSLAQLQGAYKLNATHMAQGFIQVSSRNLSFSSVRGLSARDCLFIGKHSFNKGLFDQAVQWLSAALDQARAEGNKTASMDEIMPFLSTATRVHDDVLEKKGPLGRDWRTNEKPFDQRRSRRDVIPSTTLDPITGLATIRSTDWEELEVFYKLCRGERLKPAIMEKDLKCRLLGIRTHPYFTLRRIKLEEHSLSPYIVAVHDFVSDAEAEIFKSLAIGRLERSAHSGKRAVMGGVTSDKRTSKQSWVEDSEHSTVEAVSRRISSFARLESQPTNVGSELYQVANYGIGGRYIPHTDHGILKPGVELSDMELFRGDRIATFMVYLDEVEAGGATVFTHAGVTVWPKKGMAVFWWNLMADLRGDPATRHGGCPVLHGSKWIGNKWFHSGEQLFKRPCGLHQTSRINYP